MLYDLIAFYFRRTSDLAFALCDHATKYMNAKQLRDTGDYFKALAENRETLPETPMPTADPPEPAATCCPKEGPRRASYIDVPTFFRLDWCCRNLIEAFGHPPYLVGSCLARPDFRDVDVSLMLPDEQYAAMFPNKYTQLFLNAVVSDWLAARTGLRIDFKFQDTTKANAEHPGPRNPLGCRAESFSREKP